MASNKKAPWSARAKYWADTHTGEVSGSIIGVTRMMFISMPAELRQKMLDQLNQAHADLIQKEAELADKSAEQAAE
nr:MAG TPA: hypothetical protein [Caudoviricetes sp.]